MFGKSLRHTLPAILFLFTVSAVLFAASEADEKKSSSLAAPEELKQWGFLIGQWQIKAKRFSFEGSVIEETEGSARFTFALDGTRIQERQSSILNGNQMEVLKIFAFNQNTKEWEISRTDSLHISFSNLIGSMSENRIDLVEKHPDPESSVTRRFSYTKSSDDEFVYLLEFSLNKGKTWFARSEMIYTRRK